MGEEEERGDDLMSVIVCRYFLELKVKGAPVQRR